MDLTDLSMGEALVRFLQTNPGELDETLANRVLERDAQIKRRIEEAREEIEDGVRPKGGRFRL